LFSYSPDDSDDVIERITPPVSAADGNITVLGQIIIAVWTSDQLGSQKLSAVVTVRKTK
jgi:hypothetical protein